MAKLVRLLLMGITVLAVLVAPLGLPAAQAAPIGSPQIQGTVTGGGVAQADAGVTAYVWDPYDEYWSWADSTSTDAAGHYAFDQLEPGDYRLRFAATGFGSEYWNNATSLETATTIPVTATNGVQTANADLPLPATLKGRVTNSGGTAIADVDVTAYTWNADWEEWEEYNSTTTDASGNYTFASISPGTYRLSAGGGEYTRTYYPNATTIAVGQDVVVGEAATVTANFTLRKGATVSGVVKSAAGAALADASVSLYRYDTTYEYWDQFASSTTDATGAYRFGGLAAGSYRVGAYATGYEQRYFPAATSVESASDVVVAVEGAATANFSLPVTKVLSGTVTAGGTAAANADVDLYREVNGEYNWADSTSTSATGAYSFEVSSGTYKVVFSKDKYLPQWWNNKETEESATPVVVSTGNVGGVNAALVLGGVVTGVVRGPGGAALANAQVRLLVPDPDSDTGWSRMSSQTTDATGRYSFDGLRTGRYALWFSAPGMVSEYHANVYDEVDATPIQVTQAATTTVDAALDAGQNIAGLVTNTAGAPLSGATVTVERKTKDTSGQAFWTTQANVSTAANGRYSAAVPPGTYRLTFQQSDYRREYSGDVVDASRAQRITVTASAGATVNASLLALGAYSGVVSGPSGPVDGATVSLWGYGDWSSDWNHRFLRFDAVRTDASGAYRIATPTPGSYRLGFSKPGLVTEFNADKTDVESAADVPVTWDQTVTVNAALAAPARTIGGRITYGSTDPVADIDVSVYRKVSVTDGFRWRDVDTVSSGADGRWSLEVRPGTYRIEIESRGASTWYGGGTSLETATDVVVSTSDLTALDTALPLGATVKGTVRGPAGALDGASVSLLTITDGYWDDAEWTSTKADGTYTFTHVPAGTYRVQFGKGGHVTEYYPDASSVTTAQDVVLADGQTKTLDATLAKGLTVSGKVTYQGAGVADANVSIYQRVGTTTPIEWDWHSQIDADSTGAWSTTLPPGTYTFSFGPGWDTPKGLMTEYYDNKASLSAATPVTITADRTGINADLAKGGEIGGTVTGPSGELRGLYVTLYERSGSGTFERSWHDAVIKPDGSYLFQGLPTGTYRIGFNARGMVEEFWNDKLDVASATDVSVTAGGARVTANAVLAAKRKLGGVLTVGGQPLEGSVSIHRRAADGSYAWFDSAHADADGRWRADVPPGTYKVLFSGLDERSAGEWWNNAATQAAATAVTVGASDVTNLDADLAEGATVSGTVTFAPEWSGWSTPVEVVDTGSNEVVATTLVTDTSPSYAFSGLPGGSYRVQFGRQTRYQVSEAQFWNGKSENLGVGSATVINATAGALTANVNATLAVGGAITSKVVDATGAALRGCSATAYSTDASLTGRVSNTTLTDGALKVPGLTTGKYRLRISCGGTTYYYDGAGVLSGSASSAVDISVTRGVSAALPINLVIGNEPTITNSTAPVLSGTAAVGSTLTTTNGTWTNAPTSYAYQWLRDGSPIAGATSSSYTLVLADAGTHVWVRVTAKRSGYLDGEATSLSVGPIAAPVIANTAPPTVTGTAQVGQRLTSTNGTWTNAPTSFTRQWLRDGSPIAGATGATYDLVAADQGTKISVRVTASRAGHVDGVATSAQVGPVTAVPVVVVNVTAPAITGVAQVGTPLTVSAGTWNPAPDTVSYQWAVAGVDVAGATLTTYTPVAADLGKTITVTVVAAKAGATSGSATTAPTGAVLAGKIVAPTPKISGILKVGKTVKAALGTVKPAGVTKKCQWLRNGKVIKGATKAKYLLTRLDKGKKIQLRVTYTKAGYSKLVKKSAAKLIR